MASLENRNGSYRVVFRYAGRKLSRSLETTHLTEARASVARLEDNLRRLELGLLVLPSGVDVMAFLLSDDPLVAATLALGGKQAQAFASTSWTSTNSIRSVC